MKLDQYKYKYTDFHDKPLPTTWKDTLLKYTCWVIMVLIAYWIIF